MDFQGSTDRRFPTFGSVTGSRRTYSNIPVFWLTQREPPPTRWRSRGSWVFLGVQGVRNLETATGSASRGLQSRTTVVRVVSLAGTLPVGSLEPFASAELMTSGIFLSLKSVQSCASQALGLRWARLFDNDGNLPPRARSAGCPTAARQEKSRGWCCARGGGGRRQG